MRIRLLFGILLLSLSSVSVSADSNDVYMLGRVKVVGTTATQMVLFQDPALSTLTACEKERRRGFHDRWRYYGHYVRRMAGMSLKVNYFCISSTQRFESWWDKAEYSEVYLVSNVDGLLNVELKETYASCMKALRLTQAEETPTLFCARSNQKLLPQE